MDVDKFPKSFETGCRSIIKGHRPTMDLHPIKFLFPEIRFLNEKMQSSCKMADTNRINAGSFTILQRSKVAFAKANRLRMHSIWWQNETEWNVMRYSFASHWAIL